MERDTGMKAARKSLRSGELASLAGVSSDTLRHYEQQGLLCPPPRSANGYRCYPPETLQQVRILRIALRLGFSIEELSGIFHMRREGAIPCRHVRTLASTKLHELRRRQREIKQLCKLLQTVIRRWDRRLRRTPSGKRAHLLDNLITSDSTLMARLVPPKAFVKGRKFKKGALP